MLRNPIEPLKIALVNRVYLLVACVRVTSHDKLLTKLKNGASHGKCTGADPGIKERVGSRLRICDTGTWRVTNWFIIIIIIIIMIESAEHDPITGSAPSEVQRPCSRREAH